MKAVDVTYIYIFLPLYHRTLNKQNDGKIFLVFVFGKIILVVSFTAATGPAICIILASYSGCDRFKAVAYFIASMALMGGFYSGMKVSATFQNVCIPRINYMFDTRDVICMEYR